MSRDMKTTVEELERKHRQELADFEYVRIPYIAMPPNATCETSSLFYLCLLMSLIFTIVNSHCSARAGVNSNDAAPAASAMTLDVQGPLSFAFTYQERPTKNGKPIMSD
jgi:hypothetical protein